MLGDFLTSLSAKGGEISTLQGDVEPGTPVVAVREIEHLRDTGMMTIVRFGIVASPHSVICQQPSSEDIKKPRFCIKEISFDVFLSGGAELYRDSSTAENCSEVLERAVQCKGKQYVELRSYPGDDFVYECLHNRNFAKRVSREIAIGRHIIRPLNMLALPNQTHHGIMIEGEQVVHFHNSQSDGKEAEKKAIKTDSLTTFRDDFEEQWASYKDESVEVRLKARNRAVWHFFHADAYGSYNLIWNNCENFSVYCRKGEKPLLARQVLGRSLQALGALFSPAVELGEQINTPTTVSPKLEELDGIKSLENFED